MKPGNGGEVVLDKNEAHCVMRLLAVADHETRLQLLLNRTESAKLDQLYEDMARHAVGGHLDGRTPEYFGEFLAPESLAA